MATYTAPGVYIEEQPATGPISGVGTSTAAFIGPAKAGPINEAIKITNWTQFKDTYGIEGKVYISGKYMAHAVEGFFRNGGTMAYIVRVGKAAEDKSKPSQSDESADQEEYSPAIDILERVLDINMVCIPDNTETAVQQKLVGHCEKMHRFAILDPQPDSAPDKDGILAQRVALTDKYGYGALYYPRLHIPDPQSNNNTILVPPSGHIAGIYARSDAQRGVHKAPANEMINGALKLERYLNETELGELNAAGVNVIRTFADNARPTIWGARTTAPAAETPWRYVNVRRLLIYIEESIRAGIRWAVFEPNDLALWKKIDRTLNEFLTRVWRAGALFGATPQEAFYIKCDEELNPPATRALGQLIVEVGVAPVRPAEFVIIRIGQWDGGAAVSES